MSERGEIAQRLGATVERALDVAAQRLEQNAVIPGWTATTGGASRPRRGAMAAGSRS